jgi:hypothetical protein
MKPGESREWKPPTFMQKLKGFTITMAQWVAAGRPRREPQWVAEIFNDKCKPCPFYDPDRWSLFGDLGVCKLCECHVSDDPEKMTNKIVMPNTKCPDNPPRWVAAVKEEDATDR